MTVRREIAEPRRETCARSREDLRRYKPHFVWAVRPCNEPWRTEKPLSDSELRDSLRVRGASPAGRQVRRHRACEVERHLNTLGAKKKYRKEF